MTKLVFFLLVIVLDATRADIGRLRRIPQHHDAEAKELLSETGVQKGATPPEQSLIDVSGDPQPEHSSKSRELPDQQEILKLAAQKPFPWFKVLGLEAVTSVEDCKIPYKTLALQHHPDRGGDTETFKHIGEAYDFCQAAVQAHSELLQRGIRLPSKVVAAAHEAPAARKATRAARHPARQRAAEKSAAAQAAAAWERAAAKDAAKVALEKLDVHQDVEYHALLTLGEIQGENTSHLVYNKMEQIRDKLGVHASIVISSLQFNMDIAGLAAVAVAKHHHEVIAAAGFHKAWGHQCRMAQITFQEAPQLNSPDFEHHLNVGLMEALQLTAEYFEVQAFDYPVLRQSLEGAGQAVGVRPTDQGYHVGFLRSNKDTISATCIEEFYQTLGKHIGMKRAELCSVDDKTAFQSAIKRYALSMDSVRWGNPPDIVYWYRKTFAGQVP